MYTATLDTCVLYPTYLRDTLLRLADAVLYRPLWSAHILDELERSLVEHANVSPDRATRVVTLMAEHYPDALVEGYESLIPAMTNDPKDRHVLAAAVRANAGAIVTFNVADFPKESVTGYRIEVVDPDQFLVNQLTLEPGLVLDVLEQQSASHRRPPRDVPALLVALDRAGVPQFAGEARRHLRRR